MEENISTLTLGEIVKRNYRAAEIFEKYNLDFCCGGDQLLERACITSKVDKAIVIRELHAIKPIGGEMDFDAWPLDELAEYIQQKHHRYVEEKIPLIKQYLEKITVVHGRNHPELMEIKRIFFDLTGDLAVHLKKEEFMIFPYIKKMVRAKAGSIFLNSPLFETISFPVSQLKADHAHEGDRFSRIADLTTQYTPPADACATFKATYEYLKAFEQDLHRHIHLENNILFSKAVQLEEHLATRE